MKKCLILFISIVCTSIPTNAQIQSGNKYVSIGTKTFGICFGSSIKYSGIRLSFDDLWYNRIEKISGINLSLVTSSDLFNGIQIGMLLIKDQGQVNGIAIAGLGFTGKKINGLAISSLALSANKVNGVGISLHMGGEKINGLAITGWNEIKTCTGLSIAIYNNAEKLHGFQIGLLNHVANNPKLLRWLPLINLHL